MFNNRQELNVKSLSNIAKTRFTYAKTNQNRITYLVDPMKGRVDTVEEMIEVATIFYQDLYGIKPIDRSIWNELFTDRTTLKYDDMIKLEGDMLQLMNVRMH